MDKPEQITKADQWAFDLATSLPAWFADYDGIALTIQRAFEERERVLRDALQNIAEATSAEDDAGE